MHASRRLRHSVRALALALVLACAARGEALPVVTTVELQPLGAQVDRVIEALDMLGQPLPGAVKDKIAQARKQTDPAAAVRELERACTQLGFRGAMLFSNVNGIALSDQRFWPMYEAANDLGAVLYIHPTSPVGVEAMTDFWLMPLVGFLMDTTLAAAKIVFSGIPERFPGIRWALCHLGGTIPYLVERLDRGSVR